jgi:triphosphatase
MAAKPGVSRARLVSTYYDTPDHALARRGSSLRVRRRGRHFIQTVKAAGEPGDISRGEWEDAVAGEQPDPLAAQTGPFLSPEITAQLRPLFRTEVNRLTIPLSPQPTTLIEAAIDRGRIRDNEHAAPEPISEVELELKSGEATALYDIALKLLDVAPLRLECRSKAERGYRLAAGKPGLAKAVHAAPLDLREGLSGEIVLQRFGRACLDHLLRNEDAVLAGEPDGVHQMRVAVRRLRALLSAFKPLLPKEQRCWASSELRWLPDTLGEVRNLDVFAGTLLPPARAALPQASEFERLAVAAERRRHSSHKAVIKAILSTRYTEAILALLRWFDGREWRSAGLGEGDPLRRPIDTIAVLLLDHCLTQVKKRSKDFAHQSAKQRHKLRIALKKLRYTAELLGGLYEPAETRQFIQRLKRLQDDLGDINDVRVARDIVGTLARPGSRKTGIGHAGRRLIAWHQRRLAKSEPQLRHHLDELIAAEPFWQAG